MSKIKKGLWIIGTIVVFTVVLLYPQYALDAAKAVSLMIGEQQCTCD